MTAAEAREMLSSLAGVFDVALIIDPENKEICDFNEEGILEPVMPCYNHWKKGSRCKNCIPQKSCAEHIVMDKYEMMDKDIYHVLSRPIMIDGKVFALELNTKLDDINDVNRRESLIHEQERSMEIIKILASEYSSVYYIDLRTDELTPYTMNAETESEFGKIFNQGISYSEAFRLYVDKLIYPEDQAMMLYSGSVENIRKNLEKQKTYITQYRSADNRYSEMKFVKVDDENDLPTAVALGFADRDDEIRAKQKQELEQRRNTEIIEILASEYSSVYYIDLETDELTPYAMNEETETEFGRIFRSGIKYSDAFRLYVDSLVYSEDKAVMLKAGSVRNISEELSQKKTFITTYRSDNNGNPHYCEMKFVKVGTQYGVPKAVALGFADKHEEISSDLARKAIIQRNSEIIEVLASEYTSVYYIDLTTDELTPYTMNEETENQFGVLFKNMSYSDAFRMYVDTLIVPEDKLKMIRAGSIGNIMKELRNKKTFITNYRSSNNGDPHYCEMKFVKVGDEEGNPKAVALGFADKDEELRNKIEQETVRQRNTDIIGILASEYTSVYYIDLTTDELDPYTMNEETETEFGQIFRSGINYSDAFRMYVDTLVYEDDKAVMLKAGSIYNILAELQDKKTFITTYRSDNNGNPHYCEMKFVKVGDDDNPEAVALGFADKNDEIRKELERKAENDRNFEIIRILASEYTSVYFIDMTTDALEPYTMNEDTESQFGQTFRSGINYSDAYKMYVDRFIYGSDKSMMLHAGSRENIKRELKDKKTFITTYRSNLDGKVRYCEMKFVKVGDEDAEPTAVALGFADKDEEIRLANEHRRQADFITGLSDDYDAVFFVRLNDNYIDKVRISDEYLSLNRPLVDGMTYTEYINEISKNKYFEDKEELIATLSPDNIIKELNANHAFFKNYTMIKDGEPLYYQVKLVRSSSTWEEYREFIFGIHNMDELTKLQLAQENALADARNRAEAANRSKSMFLSNMSHDIRTPMNAVLGFTEMAKKYIDDKDRVNDCLEKVLSSGKHLLNLINDVLDMSRIESGKVEINETPINIREASKSAMAIAYEAAKEKGITINLHTSNIGDLNIYGDELRISEIALNIMSNAIKYTNPGGKVDVSVEKIPGARPGRLLCDLIVEDNGIGMSEEFLTRIFEPFERSVSSTESGVQGTGLGMAITKELVERMGGKIRVESKLGKGTKVIVRFDFRLVEDGKTGSVQEFDFGPDKLKGKKVLMVEDNVPNREIAKDALEELGMIVDEAENGMIGVQKCIDAFSDNSHGYDIILMDIQMPVMDGYTATREIRSMLESKNLYIPIVAMTANAFAEDKRKAIEAGMDTHVPKPVNFKELMNIMIALIR